MSLSKSYIYDQKNIIFDRQMRFYKEVWGIIWEFNSIGEFISFTLGRVLGAIIFFGGLYLLCKCS